MTPTQTRHPWRATLRTAFAVLLALLPALPEIVDKLGLGGYGWAVLLVGLAAGVTRVLAIPQVNDLLARYFPVLSAQGRQQQ